MTEIDLAGLGLLAFMLAFTFSTAQSHFEVRVQSLAEEARIARNAFMQADLLAEPSRTQTKQLLKDYIELRSNIRKITLKKTTGLDNTEILTEAIRVSEQMQHDLWLLVAKNNGQIPANQHETSQAGSLMNSVLALVDIHYSRLHSAVMNRIPFTIWITLYLMACLSMIIMGYQAGLTDRRSPVATITLAVAFSAVIILITDLDRPIMSFFDINNQLLVDLYTDMQADLRLEYYPGDQTD